jgi:hypothetical protein
VWDKCREFAGMLTTKHGRILATIPRSTNQTSPRLGVVVAIFFIIQ